MRLSTNVKIVLCGILADEEAIRDEYQRYLDTRQPLHEDKQARRQRGRAYGRYRDLDVIGVPVNVGGWLGHEPSNSDSASFSRTVRTMDRAGLIERINWHGGNRTTHVKLTAEGRQMAETINHKGAST